MSTDQEFSIKGPIFKLALKHGEGATRYVAGEKPKTIEMAAVARLVAEGVYVWARFTPKRWVQKEGESDRWMAGAQGIADYVEFMAPPHVDLSKLKDLASSRKGKGPTKALMKRMMDAIKEKNMAEVTALAPEAAAGSLDERSPLNEAARFFPEAVSALLPHCDPDALEVYSNRPALMTALDYRNYRRFDCIPQLLAVSNILQRDTEGRTVLMIASRGHTQYFEQIMELSDATMKDDGGWTALMHAASRGNADHVKRLLPLSDPTVKDAEGRDALALVLIRDESIIKGDYVYANACASALFPHCDLGWRDPEGNTVAMIFAKRNELNLIVELGDRCNFEDRNNAGDTLLLLAARAGHSTVVAFLLPRCVVSAKGEGGDTGLIVAARANDAELVRLMRWSSDVDAQNDQGRTALMEALLTERGVHNGPTLVGAIRCALQLFPKSNLALRDTGGRTALMHCLQPELLEVFELMLPHCDANIQDAEGSTALMLFESKVAFRDSPVEFVRLLMPVTDLKLRDASGRTALMRLARLRDDVMLELLAGSDVDALDHAGRTALMHAVSQSWLNESLVDALLQVADASLVDQDGKTAADVAKDAGHEELATKIAKREFEQHVPADNETEAEAAARRKKRREKDL